jgi:hypothetical protein
MIYKQVRSDDSGHTNWDSGSKPRRSLRVFHLHNMKGPSGYDGLFYFSKVGSREQMLQRRSSRIVTLGQEASSRVSSQSNFKHLRHTAQVDVKKR